MRSWIVIPVTGAVSAGAAAALALSGPGIDAAIVVACGIAGAATTAAVRALAGDSVASLVSAVVAPLLAIATLFDPGLVAMASTRSWIAIAAFGWALVELARPTTSPLVAMLPAVVAGVLDASLVPLVAIAGARLVTAPWERPRWAIAVPILGSFLVLFAVIAGAASSGPLAALGDRWFASSRSAIATHDVLEGIVTAVGPAMAVATIAGLAVLGRARHAEIGVLACAAGAVLAAARSGGLGPSGIAIASLSAGLAIGRLAGAIRLSTGQAFAGATAALLLLVPPAWTAAQAKHSGSRVSNAGTSR